MGNTARRLAIAGAAVGLFVGPTMVAANALDFTLTFPGLHAKGVPDLGSETVSVHIDNNNLTQKLCLNVDVTSHTLGHLVGLHNQCTTP